MNILCVDTETSAFTPEEGVLVEVAYALWSLEYACTVRAGSVLMNTPSGSPVGGIPEGVGLEHGIERPLSFPKHDVVVAHQAEFDRKWLSELHGSKWICSMEDIEWPKRPEKAWPSLAALLLAHGLGVVEAHRALPDAWAIARLLTRSAEMGADVRTMLERAQRPKTLAVSLAPFEKKDLVKSHGFIWDKIVPKAWAKRMFVEDVEKLPFRCRTEM